MHFRRVQSLPFTTKNQSTKHKMTSLINSIRNRNYEEVVKLVEDGADVNTVDKELLQLGSNYDKIVEHFKIVNYLRPKMKKLDEIN